MNVAFADHILNIRIRLSHDHEDGPGTHHFAGERRDGLLAKSRCDDLYHMREECNLTS